MIRDRIFCKIDILSTKRPPYTCTHVQYNTIPQMRPSWRKIRFNPYAHIVYAFNNNPSQSSDNPVPFLYPGLNAVSDQYLLSHWWKQISKPPYRYIYMYIYTIGYINAFESGFMHTFLFLRRESLIGFYLIICMYIFYICTSTFMWTVRIIHPK